MAARTAKAKTVAKTDDYKTLSIDSSVTIAPKRSVISSTSNMIMTGAETAEETMNNVKLGMGVVNLMLREMHAETYLDAVKNLMTRGATEEYARELMERGAAA